MDINMWHEEKNILTVISTIDIVYDLFTVLFLNVANILGVDVSMSILNYKYGDESLDSGILRVVVIGINIIYLRQLHLAWNLLTILDNLNPEAILECFKQWRIWSMLVFVCVILEFHSTALSFLRGHGGKFALIFLSCKILELVLRSSGIHYFDTFKTKVRTHALHSQQSDQ